MGNPLKTHLLRYCNCGNSGARNAALTGLIRIMRVVVSQGILTPNTALAQTGANLFQPLNGPLEALASSPLPNAC